MMLFQKESWMTTDQWIFWSPVNGNILSLCRPLDELMCQLKLSLRYTKFLKDSLSRFNYYVYKRYYVDKIKKKLVLKVFWYKFKICEKKV